MTDGQRTEPRPSIGVIGAGWLGGTVGRALARAGYEVVLSTRHPERLKRDVAGLATARAGSVDEAAACEVIVMATPYDAMPDYGARFAGHFAGKVVIDATNPSGSSRLGIEGARIGVGALSQGYFPAARLVRCFCAVDATCIEDTHGYGESATLGVPLAGDDAEAVALAARLVRDTGCDPVVTGGLETACLFQRGAPGFRANTDADRLRSLMGLTQTA
ncbi:hypothetical protein BFP70_19595 [Thioclava sp. SK-1]|uniref:NADPH-dependent F420 reductase n=1 Tax=Thioclava sp. SK-1 TaxID=1889770 RepID=UPI000826AA5E|nr:NAD(P)-binding domain-containing protein [Thioclava sp. SK-1]OCX56621.1 hypothetical protein BFP70_19595 [Thioclava sp. SK-1]